MCYKLIIHCSIILSALYLANEINIFGIKIESYQSFIFIMFAFHVLFKIYLVESNEKFFNKGIIIRLRF